MNADETLKVIESEKEIQQYLGQDTNHIINFKYEFRDGKMHVYVETINPKYNQMFLFHTETGIDMVCNRGTGGSNQLLQWSNH